MGNLAWESWYSWCGVPALVLPIASRNITTTRASINYLPINLQAVPHRAKSEQVWRKEGSCTLFIKNLKNHTSGLPLWIFDYSESQSQIPSKLHHVRTLICLSWYSIENFCIYKQNVPLVFPFIQYSTCTQGTLLNFVFITFYFGILYEFSKLPKLQFSLLVTRVAPFWKLGP